jgi:hypothetical protein
MLGSSDLLSNTEHNEECFLLSLPNELISMIMYHIDPKILIGSRVLCKKWYHLTKEEILWKCKCLLFNLDSQKKPDNYSWEWYFFINELTVDALTIIDNKRKIGKLCYEDGSFYKGEWDEGLYQGYGFFKDNDCEYAGHWEKGQRHGHGTKKNKNIDDTYTLYKGEFKDNEKCKGFQVYYNKDMYDGEWENGIRNGYGSYIWILGDHYHGYWRCGNLHGFGTYIWNDKRIYTGEWNHHEQSGFGIHQWPDGSIYEGNWEVGNRHGYGTMNWSNGEKYEGIWIQDKREDDENLKLWDSFFTFDFYAQRDIIQQSINSKIKN